MVIFALLTFTSQSFAVVKFPCEQQMNQPDKPLITGATAMDHGSHNQVNNAQVNNADTADDGGCCCQEHCTQIDCVSTGAAVTNTQTPFSIQFSQTLNTAYSVSFLSQAASSLFRPPISR
jgi:hypothetical protein